jgi:hypothetical protein
MTSIVIWVNENKEELLPGLWAISDSRISNPTINSQAFSSADVLTENYPKISAVYAMACSPSDISRLNPRHVLSFGFAFSGSTLIGSTVKEILSALLSNLQEIDYYDAPELSFDQKIPSLKEVAELTCRIASNYVVSLGIHRPNSAKIEMAIFGHCTKSNALRAFRLRNHPDSPAVVRFEELPVREREFFVLGDKISAVEGAISAKRALYKSDSLEFYRAPISALLEITNDDKFRTIGGPVQLCVTGRFGIRHIPLSISNGRQNLFVGFDLHASAPTIGGFSYNLSIGLTHPSSSWRDGGE